MSDPAARPRVYGTAPGEDFSKVFVRGLLDRHAGRDPIELARVTVLVNTNRTGKRMREVLLADGARLLPRILPVTDLAQLWGDPGRSLPVPALRRRLQLSRLVFALLDQDPGLAPRAAAFDLAEALARLIDEMHEEGVRPEQLGGLDLGDLSGHWDRSLRVISIITRFFGPGSAADLTAAGALEALVRDLLVAWQDAPPADPVLVAGSTGSRGTTFRLMQGVAALPGGALVLPGYDFGQPDAVWRHLLDDRAEDHPQYRFARLCAALEVAPGEVRPWSGAAEVSARSRLVSLALRPAPVSDQWIEDGPRLGDLTPATEGLTLIEAPTARAEALAIAVALREAVGRGEVAAVISADRALTRTVAAELERWGIQPDDSAGEPLGQTPQGRLLRHAAALLVEPARIEDALVILKHPLVHSAAGRGRHMDWTRALELKLRRDKRPYPDADALLTTAGDLPGRAEWSDWVAESLVRIDRGGPRPLAEHLRHHIALVELWSGGPGWTGEAPIWAGPAGREARKAMAGLETEADHGGTLTAAEYRDLVEGVLGLAEVRAGTEAHTGVRFRGTIEARIQGADLVILAGLNEGMWPAHPQPDPWMNRKMRKAVGLTLPERRIGLSAHDFQQAVCGPKVILTRSLRDDQAETVASRWVSRMLNLLGGLPETGRPALADMRARGRRWLEIAGALDGTLPRQAPAVRPAPAPPAAVRPKRLNVTEVQTLVRDPYAIYARHVLRLRRLDPLRPEPDASVSGTLVHSVLEDFVKASLDDPARLTPAALMEAADARLRTESHWPGIRHVWRGRIEAFADWFVAGEEDRRAAGLPHVIEARGELELPGLGRLIGKPDRIDRLDDGTALILDYKTGAVPKAKEVQHFDRQLMLLAMMAEAGAFPGFAPQRVSAVAHLGLGSELKLSRIDHPEGTAEATRQALSALLAAYLDPAKGYPSRRAKEGQTWDGDYDHLARYGEWSTSDPAVTEQLE